MNYYDCYRIKFSRQRKAIWVLSLLLLLMTAAYVAQLAVTVKTERERATMESRCDEMRNSMGMLNYEMGVIEEELWSR